MKRFKQLTEELFTEGGGDSMPADEMTMSELKIACFAANNILERLEGGAMIQRWQISAIVKAKEELASVYTSISADEMDMDDMDAYDDMEDEEEPMYVGFEYPSMYGESVTDKDKVLVHSHKMGTDTGKYGIFNVEKATSTHLTAHDHNTGKKMKFNLKNNRGIGDADGLMIKKIMTEEVELDEVAKEYHVVHRAASLTGAQMKGAVSGDQPSFHKTEADAIAHLNKKYKKVRDGVWKDNKDQFFFHKKKSAVKEEVDYEVDVEGLPKMYVKANSPSEVKTNLRKVVKNPEMIRNVERVAKAKLQKMFRDKSMGKDTEE